MPDHLTSRASQSTPRASDRREPRSDTPGVSFSRFPVCGITPFHRPDARLAVALVRAGAIGAVDLGTDLARGIDALRRAARHVRGSAGELGARVHALALPDPGELPPETCVVIVPPGTDPRPWRAPGRRVFARVGSLEEALGAEASGVDGLIAAGWEAGGPVGDESTFVLLQRLLGAVDVPVWAQGGVGLHTAAACAAAGAAGVVLDSQLALVRESSVPPAVRDVIAKMDGSETVLIAGRRVVSRGDLRCVERMRSSSAERVDASLGADDLDVQLVPAGQDAAIARPLAERFVTAGGVVQAIRRSVVEHLDAAREHRPLAEGSPLAVDHGTRFPIVQGPMTRVSDTAEFADAVSRGGGLPFVALSLMNRHQVGELVRATTRRLGERPWGAGILGFVPAEMRAEQLAELEKVPPPFAIIAGGRPSQGLVLAKLGTTTYLHVPSPGLLELFLKQGARRFVFEGAECGGHVGPRSSFALWERQIEILLDFDEPRELAALFAGGVHDGRSAAMVAAMCGTLAARGVKVGVLMGTAYLFTREAVASGAIRPGYQDMAIRCSRTALLETAPGHSTRCIRNDYVDTFAAERELLEREGVDGREVWARLEQLNLGRLRLASKGLRREGDLLVDVGDPIQRQEGMYMIGQVAALRDRVTTVEALHRSVSEGATNRIAALGPERPSTGPSRRADVAVIGMACVFPGAPDVGTYWSNIVAGVDAVTEVPEDRWSPELFYDPDGRPGLTTPSKWGGFLDRIAFDPAAYGIPPNSLAAIEPVQLLSLHVARRALEDAGYARREFDRERTAVIFGAEGGTELAAGYGFRSLYRQYAGELPGELDRVLPRPTEDSFPGLLANVIAGRISNRLDLGGKNFTVDAACASSLAAVDVALESLAAGSCEMVIAGGADTHNSVGDYLLFSSVHALSPRGRCRAFDRSADGITLGEGVAALVLKRLDDAERDGDRIYAVIKGVGASSDGKSLGLTAPRKEGQVRALERAYREAGIAPSEVGLMEAHGTGTVVGDRTELESMEAVFERAGAAPGSCCLGSVKSQIGHTKCAAGMASLIKSVLAVHHGVLPPTLHVDRPNPGYDARRSPFFFAREATPWAAERRVAGVSAFGFGGTNFHAVVAAHDGPDDRASGRPVWPVELFLFRGESRARAMKRAAACEELLRGDSARPVADLARATSCGGSGPVQFAVLAADRTELADRLGRLRRGECDGRTVFAAPAEPPGGKLAFLFPGQGSQRLHMLAELFVAFPLLADQLDAGRRWAPCIWPPRALGREELRRQEARLTDTRIAQPALGLTGLAMGRVLRALGVEPDMAGGHSYGELVALAHAGAIAPEALPELSVARASAICDSIDGDPGTMAAVSAGAIEVERILEGCEGIALANHNAPRQTVISGTTVAVRAALDRLEAEGVAARGIPVACAFHSGVVAGAEAAFADALEQVDLSASSVPVYSNRSAAPYPEDPASVRRLLAEQLAHPVLFRDQIDAMYDAGARVFVEVGPGRVLSGLVDKILEGRPHLAVNTDAAGESGLEQLQRALAVLAVHGIEIDARALFAGRGGGAELVDVEHAPPDGQPPLAWWVNGHRAWPVRGELPATAMRPVTSPPLRPTPAGAGTAGSKEAAVLAYLRNLREMAEAQRQVMLGLVGSGAADRAIGAPDRPVDATGSAPAAGSRVSPAAMAEATAPSAPAAPPDLGRSLLAIVSERTGYPVEMLDLDLDLEADLSIDSIKRIEILGALSETLGMVAAPEAGREEVVEELATIKTLRGIIEWLEAHAGEVAGADASGANDPEASIEAPAAATHTADESLREEPSEVQRYLLEVHEISPASPNGRDLAGRSVAVAADGLGVGRELAARLERAGATVHHLEPGERLAAVDGLVDLSSLLPDAGPDEVKRLFRYAKQAVRSGASMILAATGMGGDFGRNGNGRRRPGQGGVAGLLKSLSKERPAVHVRAVDLDPDESPARLAGHLFDEILASDEAVEVGYRAGRRRILKMVRSEEQDRGAGGLELGRESVVLVTGGARGITARIAVRLARRFGCALELVGRTPLPAAEEDPELARAGDEVELKRLLAARGGVASTPSELDRIARRVLAEREIRETLREVAGAGSAVRYHAVDVRDARAFGKLIDAIYERHGRIDGVIHGAGVIEDKLLVDKTAASFDRVFDTKVKGALTVASKLRAGVAFVVFFSSVSGAFGNRGQTDYAAANDLLDKLAHHLNEKLPGRVLSVNWGPWDARGMVSAELRREYRRRGIGLIPLANGPDLLLSELGSGDKRDAQVILVGGAEPSTTHS